MLYRAHRGGGEGFPENTMHSFNYAWENGFEMIETDPQYTRDGKIILMHDDTVNRTCRYADGSKIEKEIKLADITYNELSKLDAGIYAGEQFKGAKVPLLEELLSFCEGKNISLNLDKKIGDDEIDPLLDVVSKYNVRVEFSCGDVDRIKIIQKRFPNAFIGYDGPTRDEDLKKVCALVAPENLLVCLYMDKPNFAWLVDRDKVSKESCERVKKYANLLIANVRNEYDLREAFEFEPYMIEIGNPHKIINY